MKNEFDYTPRDIAYGLYLQSCYTKLINAAKRGEPLKKVDMVRSDLQSQLSKLSISELQEFDKGVKENLQDIENRHEIRRLRLKISKYKDRISELKDRSGEDNYTPKEMKR